MDVDDVWHGFWAGGSGGSSMVVRESGYVAPQRGVDDTFIGSVEWTATAVAMVKCSMGDGLERVKKGCHAKAGCVDGLEPWKSGGNDSEGCAWAHMVLPLSLK